eukprot:366462-Chlamydomonas_euryale.AAC.26
MPVPGLAMVFVMIVMLGQKQRRLGLRHLSASGKVSPAGNPPRRAQLCTGKGKPQVSAETWGGEGRQGRGNGWEWNRDKRAGGLTRKRAAPRGTPDRCMLSSEARL